MCDFRNPPYKVIRLKDNVELDATYRGHAAINKQIAEWDNLNVLYGNIDDTYSIGVYYIVATGSFYSYYNGKQWLCGYDDYFKRTIKFIFDENSHIGLGYNYIKDL